MWSEKDNDIVRDENEEVQILIYNVLGDREEQQDTFGYLITERKCYCVVADGMGGMNAGKMASQYTVKECLQGIHDGDQFTYDEELLEPIRKADDYVFAQTDENGNRLNAGTTVVGVMIQNSLLNWASVGDSRAYLFRGGKYVQLTKDQNYRTYLDESLRAGAIDYEEYKNQISRQEALINYIGMGNVRKSRFIDTNEVGLELASGDIILVMSDGVYKILSDEEINRIVANVPDIINMAQTLEMKMTSKANANRLDRDNTTLAVIKVK